MSQRRNKKSKKENEKPWYKRIRFPTAPPGHFHSRPKREVIPEREEIQDQLSENKDEDVELSDTESECNTQRLNDGGD